MSPFEELLSKRMIIRDKDTTLYYRIKDDLKSIRKIVQDKFGFIVTVTPQLIKLEKIPAIPEIWMGIQAFKSIEEYQMFCYLLMFLEDKEIEEQFVLSHLTQYMQHASIDKPIDWTVFTTRRQLIRVMQFALANHLIILNDGIDTNFSKDINTEVLYENTGVSRYFVRNFAKNISEYQMPTDFFQSDWIDIDEDRGMARRHRVYRKLLLSNGMYDNDLDEDFLYLRNQHRTVQRDFESWFPCDLHLYKSSAYLVLDESCTMGRVFPENNVMSDLTLMVHSELRNKVSKKKVSLNTNEQIIIDTENFHKIVEKVIKNTINMLPKKYQEDGIALVTKQVINYMEQMNIFNEEDNIINIYPIVGKIVGSYNQEDSV